MFFNITKQPDPRFPHCDPIGTWWFNHDTGWQVTENGWYKGYRYHDIGHGNFCAIRLDNDIVHLDHDVDRSFPLWWNSKEKFLSNFITQDRQIWVDKQVRLSTQDIIVEHRPVTETLDLTEIPLSEATDKIRKNLEEKFRVLKTQKIAKKIYVSGGVDTMILWSMVNKYQIPCELVDYEYFIYDQFTNNFINQIKTNHWCYDQVHHWNKECLLLSGACGDEYMFRGPTAIAMWMAWHNIDMIPLLEKSSGYHRRYFLLEKNLKIFQYYWQNKNQLRQDYPELSDLCLHLIDRNLNDHQHWHIGNTLTWTPFKDIEIFKILLKVNARELLDHFLSADISFDLMGKQFADAVSRQKNFQTRENLHNITAAVRD